LSSEGYGGQDWEVAILGCTLIIPDRLARFLLLVVPAKPLSLSLILGLKIEPRAGVGDKTHRGVPIYTPSWQNQRTKNFGELDSKSFQALFFLSLKPFMNNPG
jgi:hypothetical protein